MRIGWRFILLAGIIVLLAAMIGLYVVHKIRRENYFNPERLTLRRPIEPRQSAQDEIKLVALFPTGTMPSPVFRGNFVASPQLVNLAGRPPFLLLVASQGAVAGMELRRGELLWKSTLHQGRGEEIFARAAPAQFNDKAMIAFTATNGKSGAVEHRAVVIDLADGRIDRSFPTLLFEAEVAATGGGTAKFDPQWHLPRAITIVPAANGLGRAYVTFGGNRDQFAWHGWLYEIDLDKWRRGFAKNAISSVFVATPEADCDDDAKICGGGMWAYAGVQVHHGAGGPELLVQTGNGRFDLSRRDYSQSLLRLSPGLDFDPQCNPDQCAGSDPRNPAPACLATCKNLFVPRLRPGEPPLKVPGGACDGKTYLQCLEAMDWDFGSSSPVRVEAAGRGYYFATGKAGDVYLIDGDVLGLMHDRKQAAAVCGTPTTPCPSPYDGLAITQPATTMVGGKPLVVIGTYNIDGVHPAGAVAYYVVGAPARPRLEEAWRVPPPSSPASRKWFRAPPSRPLITFVAGEPIVWIAENGADGRILAIRARDGKVLANVRTAGWPMRNSLPVIAGDILYLPAAVQGREDVTWIEAYRIVPDPARIKAGGAREESRRAQGLK